MSPFSRALRLLPWIAVLLAAGARAHGQGGAAPAPYAAWQHTDECWILTDEAGANLPAGAVVRDFPLLVRLHGASFDFREVQAHGEDLRFSDSGGQPLHYQIEDWDAAAGNASVWVCVPRIIGNARQLLRLYWGNSSAQSESDGRAVFGEFNGFVSKLHMDETLRDSVGTVHTTDERTTAVRGRIGSARHLDGDSGLFCGDDIRGFPDGASASSTEAWFWTERSNTTVLAWGQEQRPGKVMLNLLSPPHVAIQCYFADVVGQSPLTLGQWNQVVHTYERGDSRVYLNGVLDGASTPILDIPRVVRFDIGGWHGHGFVGDIDEVRISTVARAAEWIRLQYENQKPLQTLVGPLVTPGAVFSTSVPTLSVPEGASARVSAQAGGAQKVYWLLEQDGRETVAAVDQFEFTLVAGRVTRDTTLTLRWRAVYADSTRTIDIPVTIRESVPEPVFTLAAPPPWDGRQTLTIEPKITNLSALQARSAATLKHAWRLEGVATVKRTPPGKLVLERAQASGTLTVHLTIDNGGAPVSSSIAVVVQEPERDDWIAQPLEAEEYPEEGQFFARDEHGRGSLVFRGRLAETADSVFLRVTADGKPYAEQSAAPGADRSFALAVRLEPGLVHYKAEFGAKQDGRESELRSAGDLLCGDAYIVTGQSNALATDFEGDDPPYQNEWVRTFGSTSGEPALARTHVWGKARCRDRERSALEVGYWALELGRRLVESQQIPVCILNGAAGGTRIDQHQRNAADPEDVDTIYGRLLWRVRQAKLTHGIRAVLWHQGENDQGADGPSGRFGWETYHDLFVELAAGWRRDFPNVEHYYVFQIWPKACAMGFDGSDDMLREVQRQLPRSFGQLSTMSTLGIVPPGDCHYPFAGWAEFAHLIQPLIERDLYDKVPLASITPPDLKRAFYADAERQRIVLEFDQPVAWTDELASQFYLDGVAGVVSGGSVTDNTLVLALRGPSAAHTLTYLDGDNWSQNNLLRGANGIAALTFCRVPIESSAGR